MMVLSYSPLPVAGLWQAYGAAGLMGQMIVGLLLGGLIWAWASLVRKSRELRAINADCRGFLHGFTTGKDTLDLYLSQSRRAETGPFDVIYQKTCERLVTLFDRDTRVALIGRRGGEVASAALTAREIRLVACTSGHTMAEQVVRVERGLSALAAVALVAPLVGLLGTAWGVLEALQVVAEKGSAAVVEWAPMVSSSLLTTMAGLLVAILSGMGYTVLRGRVRALVIDIEGFADELTARIACEFQGKGE
jgi:biopolymer transport protein ExbB/TolQ